MIKSHPEESDHLDKELEQARTELKNTIKVLERSESHLRTLLNTIPELVWLKDAQGTYLGCNKRFERFFGSSEADIVGKTDYDFVDKKLADQFRENDARALAKGKPSVNEEEVTYADDGWAS